jgi:hypothetical protein
VIVLQARLLQLRENSTVALFLIPVVKESFSLSVLMGYVGIVYPRAVSPVVAQSFSASMQTLRTHYEVVNSISVMSKRERERKQHVCLVSNMFFLLGDWRSAQFERCFVRNRRAFSQSVRRVVFGEAEISACEHGRCAAV